MSFALRKLKKLKKKVDRLNQELDYSKNEIKTILTEMTDEFSSAGIALEQFINVVESDEESTSNPTNVELPTDPQPTQIVTTPIQDEAPLASAPTEVNTVNTELAPTLEEETTEDPITSDEADEKPSLVTEDMISESQSDTTELVEEQVESDVDVSEVAEMNEVDSSTSQDDIDSLTDDKESEVDDCLPEQSKLSYSNKEEVDFSFFNNSAPSADSKDDVEPTDLEASHVDSSSTTSTVNAEQVPEPEQTPEVGRVVGMISDKLTYVHSGMKVTKRKQRKSDEIGLKVVV
ncbi:hypothetical protein VYA_42530 (plasmid) [Vibrio alfacsensis]|nr:hypothetical protein [Vibrio sp. 04Ya108]BBM67578.1 hypothetical protein VA249_42240 [Vibrio alfacsensis]BCN27061.1 hypothetical protein VYA_42530 [Vibrio alfacsensis]